MEIYGFSFTFTARHVMAEIPVAQSFWRKRNEEAIR